MDASEGARDGETFPSNRPDRRRFLRFSTRRLLLAVTLVSLPCAWVSRRLIASHIQAEAVRALTEQGVSIGYLHEWDHVNDRFSGAGPPGPAFLRELFGEHFFLEPDIFIVAEFHGEKEALTLLAELPTLRAGGIVDTPIGDEIIPVLTQLHRIEDLSLYGTKVTDRGILRLTELPRLKNLVVSKTLVTEEGVQEFQRRCPDCVVHLEPDCVVHLENDDSDE